MIIESASDHLPPPLVALLYMVLVLIGVTFASLHQHVSSSPPPLSLSLSSPPAQIRRNQKGGQPLNITKVNSKIRSIHQICVLTCQPLDYLSCHYLALCLSLSVLVIISACHYPTLLRHYLILGIAINRPPLPLFPLGSSAKASVLKTGRAELIWPNCF